MDDTTKVDDQDAINHRTAEMRGWVIPPQHVYKDNSASAWKRNRKRPRWDAMLGAIERGEIQAIVVYHGDRLIRQPYDLEMLINLADQKGIKLASPTGTRDLDNSDDRFILRIEAAQACRESDNTSRRTKNGHRRRREQGRVRAGGRGGRAFAFETNGLTHIEDEKAVLRELARRVLAGERVGELARELNERAAVFPPTGGRWQHATIKKMLMRPRYAGLLPDGETPAAWEPLYADDRDEAREVWESVCAVLERRAAAFDYATNARRYLLTGIARCGTCGQPVAIRHNTRDESLRGYGCINPDCGRKVHRQVRHVDRYVVTAVLELLADPEFMDEVARPPETGVAMQINALTARKKAAEQQLANLADVDVDPALIVQSLASFDRRIRELRGQMELTARRRLLLDHAGLSREEWKGLPLDTQRALVAACFRVTIIATGRRGPGFDPESVDLDPVGDE